MTDEIKKMCSVESDAVSGPSPIPEDGIFTYVKEQKDISGLTHAIGWCAPKQGACKLTLNIKNGIIEEALVETVGCSGMTHSAAMAGEILPGKTLIEALNTDLVCDAINTAMKELFLQIVYGRSQSAYSKGGLQIGAGLEDLGKYKQSQLGSVYSTKEKGVRYLNLTEGYILSLGLDDENKIIGYKYINTGKMLELLKTGIDPVKAVNDSIGIYGRYKEALKKIDPRKE